jgi:hypothetical protein
MTVICATSDLDQLAYSNFRDRAYISELVKTFK